MSIPLFFAIARFLALAGIAAVVTREIVKLVEDRKALQGPDAHERQRRRWRRPLDRRRS